MKTPVFVDMCCVLPAFSTKTPVFVETCSFYPVCPRKGGFLWIGAKQKPHRNAEPTQKHKTLIWKRSPVRRPIFQYFSIFLSGCKQPNLSTFRTVSRRSLSFSGCKDTQKSGYANFIFSRIRKSGLKTIFKFRHIIKKCYLRALKTIY